MSVISTWQAPQIDGTPREELLVQFSKSRETRILVLPAWFDEANKLRRLTVETMRWLNDAEIDSFLPDLPGCNESLAPLEAQTLDHWRFAAEAAARELEATHILAMRAGALIAPQNLPGWSYAEQKGSSLIRLMVRARLVASREAGRQETREELMQLGCEEGLMLGGWPLGAGMFAALASATEAPPIEGRSVIEQSEIGGGGLWLRSEPSHDAAQAEALAQRIISDLSDTKATQA